MKKADVAVTVYFRIFEILLLVVVIGIISTQVGNVKDSGVYQKKFLSRDLAMIMDSMANARGNLVYYYSPLLITKLQDFEIDFSSNAVIVDEESWPYAANLNYNPAFPPKGKFSALVLKKMGNSLVIEKGSPKTTEINGFLLDCPTAQLSTTSVIIDPGHRYSDTDDGLSGGLKDAQGRAIPESELVLKVAAALEPQLKPRIPEVLGTRDLKTSYVAGVLSQQTKPLRERIAFIASKPDSIIISLHAGKQSKNHNIVKAYVNIDSDERSYRLACLMLNSIATAYRNEITGTAIIPVDLTQLSPEDPKQVLLKGNPGVLLELGNIENPNNKLLGSPVELAQALAGGIG